MALRLGWCRRLIGRRTPRRRRRDVPAL